MIRRAKMLAIVNEHLTNVYACTEHLLKHNDHITLIQQLKQKHNNVHYHPRYDLNTYYPKSEWRYIVTNLGENGSIYRHMDIVVGFLFKAPEFKVNDKINVCFNCNPLCSITICKLNKIYKPLDDLFYILRKTHPYGTITLERANGKPINKDSVKCLSIISFVEEIDHMTGISYHHILNEDRIFINNSSMGGICRGTKNNLKRLKKYSFQMNYPYDYYANIIIRGYRRYKKKCYILERVKYKDIVTVIEKYVQL